MVEVFGTQLQATVAPLQVNACPAEGEDAKAQGMHNS